MEVTINAREEQERSTSHAHWGGIERLHGSRVTEVASTTKICTSASKVVQRNTGFKVNVV